MSSPLVSILMPCFNNERTLARSIESALAQTGARCELIVVDDGSRDGSLALARSYEARGVRVLSQSNQGAGVARNTALAAAQGDYLQYLDADDLLSPDKIAGQVRLLQGLGDRHVATCRWGRFVDSEADVRFGDDDLCRDLDPVEFLLLAANENRMMHTAAWLVPRSLAEKAGPWDLQPSPNDDGEYFCRVMLESTGLAFSATGCSYYRSQQTGTLSSLRRESACRGILHSMELISRRLLAHEDSPRTRAGLANHFQRIVYLTYAQAPAVAAAAAERAQALGGSTLLPEMGGWTRALSRVLGWKLTLRIKHLLKR
ncbi:MAG: glycosyltransferase family 2 protein [Verrucomicrobia bacterium]|nr:glycosyltransferase family 2 protein [Verrucomicrobiota bacterium]